MEPLSDRKQALLGTIIEEYIKTVKPIGSQTIVDKYSLGVSPATIRNDMKELEDMGYITHPHTSAGRIPTEAGYRFYIQHFINRSRPLSHKPQQDLVDLVQAISVTDHETAVKMIAKGLAALSEQAVLVSFNPHSFYYTGISNMFQQPEFHSVAIMAELSQLIDQLDEVMSQLHRSVGNDITILIGSDNPVSHVCSAIVVRYQVSDTVAGTLALLGPMRMNYQFNYQLMKYVPTILRQRNEVSPS